MCTVLLFASTSAPKIIESIGHAPESGWWLGRTPGCHKRHAEVLVGPPPPCSSPVQLSTGQTLSRTIAEKGNRSGLAWQTAKSKRLPTVFTLVDNSGSTWEAVYSLPNPQSPAFCCACQHQHPSQSTRMHWSPVLLYRACLSAAGYCDELVSRIWIRSAPSALRQNVAVIQLHVSGVSPCLAHSQLPGHAKGMTYTASMHCGCFAQYDQFGKLPSRAR